MGKKPLHVKILYGLILGALAGVAANLLAGGLPGAAARVDALVRYVTVPVGQVFLRLLFMTVVPLVLSTLAVGVAKLGDSRRIGRIGLKTLLIFLGTTAAGVVTGLVLVNLARPGEGFDPGVQQRLLDEYRGTLSETTKGFAAKDATVGDLLVRIIPRNPFAAMAEGDMLAVIFFALLLGIALTRVKPDRARPVLSFLEGLSEVMITLVGFVMKLAPVAVPALIFSVTARFGLPVLQKLSVYVATVFVGYLLFQFGFFGLVARFGARMSPVLFFRKITVVMVTAFSTSSSNATLPTTLKVTEEELGVSPDLAGFVLPLGATLNMNGTALYEGVTVLFLAQVFGITLTLGQQALVVLLAVLMAVGTAGVPGASLPMIMMVLSTVGVPPDAIAMILGVDRVLDMGRTVLNVTGDITTTLWVARMEGGKAGGG